VVQWYIAAIIGAACAIVGIFAGIVIRRIVAEKQIGSAEQQAKKLLEDAIKAAETKRKEFLFDAKEEIQKS
jgi:ribonuclease Y